jgi:RNA polymerase sigma-70 factor (ECF subfamily)
MQAVDNRSAADPRLMGDYSSPEQTLILAAQSGEVDAFEAIYEAHRGRVYGLCLRMTGNRAQAEDLTQDSFVRAWEKLDTFRGASTFSTWLYRLTVNVVLGELRKRGDRQKEHPEGEGGLRPEPSGGTPYPSLAIDLEQAIARLPQTARLVFLLYDVEGYRHREIAEMTGLAEGTSKAHLHRARRLLRKALTS